MTLAQRVEPREPQVKRSALWNSAPSIPVTVRRRRVLKRPQCFPKFNRPQEAAFSEYVNWACLPYFDNTPYQGLTSLDARGIGRTKEGKYW